MNPNMAYIEEKLQRIQKIVNDSVRQKESDEIKRIEDELEQKRIETENTAKEEYVRKLEEAEKKYKTLLTESVLEIKSQMKQKVLRLRDDIKQETFSEVFAQLKKFRESENYLECLIRKTRECFDELGDGEKVIIIDKTDEKFKDDLERTFGSSVELSSDNILGGVIVRQENRLCDNSFMSAFITEKNNFLKNSGLNLKWH